MVSIITESDEQKLYKSNDENYKFLEIEYQDITIHSHIVYPKCTCIAEGTDCIGDETVIDNFF